MNAIAERIGAAAEVLWLLVLLSLAGLFWLVGKGTYMALLGIKRLAERGQA